VRSDICNLYGVVFCLTDMKNLTITLLALLVSGGLSSEYLENLKIKRVVDGDTVHVFSKGEVLKVRLVEIDTPEMDQPHGQEAKEYLENLLKDGYINLDISGTDIYKRKLGRIYWKEKDINRLMVKSGHAWVYDQYVTDQTFYEDQNYARSRKLGLWNSNDPIQPWQWRRRDK
jgi:endonuclease YncB( thermonuclease family)